MGYASLSQIVGSCDKVLPGIEEVVFRSLAIAAQALGRADLKMASSVSFPQKSILLHSNVHYRTKSWDILLFFQLTPELIALFN